MAACCIGGVCIPYSAILPLLFIALQYIARPIAKAGLLPDFIVKYLGLDNASSNENNDCTTSTENDSQSCRLVDGKLSCCMNDNKNNNNSTTTNHKIMDTSSSSIITIESYNDFKSLSWQKNSILFVKFTAEWCKPCKVIQPFYQSLATKYSTSTSQKTIMFAQVDVDELDDVASECGVKIMPTFVVFKDGVILEKLKGSSEEKLELLVKKAVMT